MAHAKLATSVSANAVMGAKPPALSYAQISDVGEVRAKCTSLLADALAKGAEGSNAPEAGDDCICLSR